MKLDNFRGEGEMVLGGGMNRMANRSCEYRFLQMAWELFRTTRTEAGRRRGRKVDE